MIIPNIPYAEQVDKIKSDVNLEEIKAEVRQEIADDFPSYGERKIVDSEKVTDDIYGDFDIKKNNLVVNDDVTNLTLFDNYMDYTLAFARKYYEKESFSSEELDGLVKNKDFLREKSFYSKRNAQCRKIAEENKRLKSKMNALGESFSEKLKNVVSDYDDTVAELTTDIERIKNMAESDRVEKIQSRKFSSELVKLFDDQTECVNQQNQNIADLEEIIFNQKSEIDQLKKKDDEQAMHINNLKEKISTVIGIVKED